MMMLLPSVFHFSRIDQMLLSQGMTTRLLMACAMGGLIGIEREWRHKASGLRTNMLICMGCALFTMLSAVLAGEANPDKGRVASNIVQGIGFLGAGLILHTRNRVLGLTSAATVFVVASIGMACGAGLYIEAALATLIVLLALTLIGSLEWRVGWQRYPMVYEVRGTDQGRMYSAMLQVLDAAGERLSILERESVAGLERVAFVIKATRAKHQLLIRELRAKDAADQVMAFNDPEEE
jgi:putative Mg2+ transporter-C (MgtC) family protein